jgi:hypothetical protein
MNVAEAVKVVREQTIPGLRGSGGDGHAQALETVLAHLERLSKQYWHLWMQKHHDSWEVRVQLRDTPTETLPDGELPTGTVRVIEVARFISKREVVTSRGPENPIVSTLERSLNEIELERFRGV